MRASRAGNSKAVRSSRLSMPILLTHKGASVKYALKISEMGGISEY